METIQQELELSAGPYFTTLQKFFSRIKILYLRYAFGKILNLFYFNDDLIPSRRSIHPGLPADIPVTKTQSEPARFKSIS
jgi:hypothetical protein